MQHVRPIFIDLETRSAADLKVVGGWNYAQHESTSLLTVSWSESNELFSVWMPTVDEEDPELLKPPSQQLIDTHLPGVRVFYGAECPEQLRSLTSRPWYAHNAWTFDQVVWERLVPDVVPVEWGDTYPLALACGLPGGLNQIGQRLWGQGKYEEGNRIAKEATRVGPGEEADPVNVPAGRLVQVARYNVQDVRLLAWLWEEIESTLVLPEFEQRVLQIHRLINSRGVRVDKELLAALVRLSTDCRTNAIAEIAELTRGELSTLKDLRSRKKVFDWLERVGVNLGKNPSLRKELIQKYIEKHSRDEQDFPEEQESELEDDESELNRVQNLPLGLKVLELRMSAMRITDAKLEAAAESLNYDSIVRGLFAYWAAHTGRWAGRRIQVHNLPKPKEGVDTWKAIKILNYTKRLPYEGVTWLVNREKTKAAQAGKSDQVRFLSADDYSSALIRSLFIPRTKDGLLAAADLANIENRVLAWLAGEEWLMQSFWAGTDPYMALAVKMFGPTSKWDMTGVKSIKKHPNRAASKVVELGSGFQLGEVKLTVYAASMGIDLDAVGLSPRKAIEAYRDSHPAIAGTHAGDYHGRKYYRGGFWDQLNEAAIKATQEQTYVQVGRLAFEFHKGHLLAHLPSGRRLVYRNARVAWVTPSYAKGTNKTVLSVQYASPRFGWKSQYGGAWAENVVQATARDFLAHAIVLVESAGMPVVLHVHDEVVAETKDLDGFMSAMTTLPPWAPEFPLEAEGSLLPRYAKSPPPGVSEVVYRNGRIK